MLFAAPPIEQTTDGIFPVPAAEDLSFETGGDAAFPELEYVIPYTSMVIPMRGGTQFLYLAKPLQLKVEGSGEPRISVLDWNITITANSVKDPTQLLTVLEREIVRKFALLSQKATSRVLNEQEESQWQALSLYVDYTRYSEATALPMYHEFVLLRKNDRQLRLVMDDGRKCSISNNIVKLFDEFNDGERIAGHININANDSVVEAYGLIFVIPPSESENDSFRRWLNERGL
jgi:hypothetical protein